jgi:hypothetical protein
MPEVFKLLLLTCAALLAVVRPWFALALILVLGLFGSLFPALQDIRALSVIAIAGAVGILPYILRAKVRGWPLAWPVVFFCLFVLNSTVIGDYYGDYAYFYLLAGAICTYYLVLVGIRSRIQVTTIAWAAIGAGVGSGVIFLLNFGTVVSFMYSSSLLAYSSQIHNIEKPLVSNPNYLFPLLMPGMFFSSVMYFTRTSRLMKIVLLGCLGIMALGVLSTLSRGSALSMATIGIALLLLEKRSSFLRIAKELTAVLGVAVVAYLVRPEIFELLIVRLTGTDFFGSRPSLQLLSLQHFIESPLWGVGFGRLAIDVGIHQHDGYTALLGEMGLIGFILFYSLPFMLLLRVHRMRRFMQRCGVNDAYVTAFGVCEAFMIGILILNLFNTIVFSKTAFFLFAVIHLLIMGKGRKQTRGSVAMIEFIESWGIGGASQSPGVSHDLGQVGRWNHPPVLSPGRK